jgi:hypothetical protein
LKKKHGLEYGGGGGSGWHTLGTEEGPGNVQVLGTHNDDTLAIEDLLGDNGGQTTQEVTLTIDNNNLLYAKERWISNQR